jgi:hypothetical protein
MATRAASPNATDPQITHAFAADANRVELPTADLCFLIVFSPSRAIPTAASDSLQSKAAT